MGKMVLNEWGETTMINFNGKMYSKYLIKGISLRKFAIYEDVCVVTLSKLFTKYIEGYSKK